MLAHLILYRNSRQIISTIMLGFMLGAAAPQASADVRSKLDDYFRRLEAHGFSGSVLVAQGEYAILKAGYGLAERERELPVTPDTAFDVGSISKQFTAAAIMLLEQRGKLSTEDAIGLHLDFLPDDKRDITLHQLLTHTSGLGGAYWDQNRDLSRIDYLRKIANENELRSPPGELYKYSNFGYDLLGLIVEKASGMSYEAFLVEQLFRPSGMMYTGFEMPDWADDQVAHYQDWVTREWTSLGISVASPLKRPAYFGPIGSGALLSTVGDMWRWHKVLLGDELLSDVSRAKLFTPSLDNYAYGWHINRLPDGTQVMHHGGYDTSLGVAAGYYRVPDQDLVLVVLANTIVNRQFRADDAAKDIFKILNGLPVVSIPEGIALPARQLEAWEGTYKLPAGSTIDIVRSGRQLVLSTEDSTAALLLTFPDAYGNNPRPLPPDVLSVIEGMAHDDWEPLRAALWENVTFERYRASIGAWWNNRRDEWGPFVSASLAHEFSADYDGEPEHQIFIVLRFDSGMTIIRALLNPAGRLFIDRPRFGEQLVLNLAPQSESEFQGWFFNLQTGPRLKFFADRVEIHGKTGHVTARKLTPGVVEAHRAQRRQIMQEIQAAMAVARENANADAADIDKATRRLHLALIAGIEVAIISEDSINSLGYDEMGNDHIALAIAIFAFNTEHYPKSSNAFDSLGEAYMKNGQGALALLNYEKSLKLDPSNDNAHKMIRRIRDQ